MPFDSRDHIDLPIAPTQPPYCRLDGACGGLTAACHARHRLQSKIVAALSPRTSEPTIPEDHDRTQIASVEV